MFTFYWVVRNFTENEVDWLMMLAANHKLRAYYKIGVYGRVRQNELYVVGGPIRYHRFKKALRSIKNAKKKTTQREKES